MHLHMNNDLQKQLKQSVKFALAEDIGSGDLTAALISKSQMARAKIISRETAVICGIPWVNEVFEQVDDSITIDWKVTGGDQVIADQVLCEIFGNARNILTAERCALNFLQTLSATATTTRQYARLIEDTKCHILDTRKTIPGLRLAQKYAVTVGGGKNHRIGLYDGILIKENHIQSAGSLTDAVKNAIDRHGDAVMIEVEVESLEQLKQALAAGAKRIMLDNFDLAQLSEAVQINQSRAELEASGNISKENIREIALTGVDYVSLGALTKHIQAIDLSLLFEFRN